MRIWLVKSGEPIPTDFGNPRLMRTGILATFLEKKGIDVTWWTSTFYHQKKIFRSKEYTYQKISNNYSIRLVKSLGYDRNISIRRFMDDFVLAINTYRRMNAEKEQPDLIVCSYPLMYVSYFVARYASKNKIPFVIDARDMWPDIFSMLDGKLTALAGKLFGFIHGRLVRNIFGSATGIVGITNGFLSWALKYAGRAKSDNDRVFPLTNHPTFNRHNQDQQLEYWEKFGVTKDTLNICYCGVFSNKVDLETVISAIRNISEKKDVRLVLCGAGDDLEKITKLADNAHYIVLPGWVDSEKITALMNISVLGLAPYKNRFDFLNSIPNKIVEYMAAGLPFMTGLGGDVENMVKNHECGILYKQGDVEQLSDLINTIVTDKKTLRRISDNGLKLYYEEFEANKIYTNYVSHLVSLINT